MENQDYSHVVRSLMQRVELHSFRALADHAGVSEWQVRQLRRGQAADMRLTPLLRLSQALELTLDELVTQCSACSLSPTESESSTKDLRSSNLEEQPRSPESNANAPMPESQEFMSDSPSMTALQYEYQRLQEQLTAQRQALIQEFQRTSLQILESWMMYWPAAVHATQANPDLPATRLVPLVRPVEQLLAQWEVEAIAPIAAEVPYEPQWHQLIDGHAEPGQLVRIRNPGYRHRGALLHRAKVKPINV